MALDYDQILGPELTFKGAVPPPKAPIDGKTVRLEPIEPARHVADLYEVSKSDDTLWNYMGYGPFADQAAMKTWLDGCAASSDPLFFAIIDKATARTVGMLSFMRIDAKGGAIEIGHIWFAPILKQTRQATEAIFLTMRETFDRWGYRRLEWKCNSRNMPSRAAALRFGFTYEGLFRQHLIVRGRNRDTCWFSMLDGEWPEVKAAFERWLDPSNFDAAGKQKKPLAARRPFT
ncbi:MAG: GNAT family N-acetyltransferase [Rhodospirillaceae bacterium]|nr:GNAT family N-acetyltransferase [Rhodospirillaceae bacterium]